MRCTITRKLKIELGDLADYKALSYYHYRENHPGPYSAIFAIKADKMPGMLRKQTVGVIVYALPAKAVELRNVALGETLRDISASDKLSFINKNIRNISRVVIEPRFRGLGLAARLVRETLHLVNIPVVEALAVMGHVNPFFEKAGMKAYTGPHPVRCVQLIEAFSAGGIAKRDLIDPRVVMRKLEILPKPQSEFINGQMEIFLQSYGSRRNMSPGLERTKFILSKLTDRPVYYIWFSPSTCGRSANM